MAANMGKPCPVDPLWYRRDCLLRITCGCSRQLKERVGDFEARHRLRADLKFYEVIRRLRCSRYGGPPKMADVVRSGR
jgi:hypothetical protein